MNVWRVCNMVIIMKSEEKRLKELLKRCLNEFELEHGQNYMYLGSTIKTLIEDLKNEFKDEQI
jgi:hypothetical protein